MVVVVGLVALAVTPRLVAYLLNPSLSVATTDTLSSPLEPETAATLRRLADSSRDGDALYVYLSGQYPYRYYLQCECFGTRAEARKLKALWPVRPTGGHAQFSPALKSASPLFVAGTATGGKAENYRLNFRPLRGRHRVWYP
jgi:hypothetical protein